MRVGHKYVPAETGSLEVDASVDQLAETMGYAAGRYATREEFLRAHDQRWVRELHEALSELLDPGRLVLGLGSGEGEHEVLLGLAGYRVIASDIVPGVLGDAARLFPEIRTMELDVFGLENVSCDDILITGMDSYFDDTGAEALFRAVRARLPDDGRLVFVLRYRDSPVTTLIDRVGIPLAAQVRRLRGAHLEKKAHGYRRSTRDIRALAGRAGLHVGRVRYAAFGMEFERLLPAPRPLVALDRRIHVLNSATVLELLPS